MKKICDIINVLNEIDDNDDYNNAIGEFLEILNENFNDDELEVFNELLEEAIEISETYDTIPEESLMESHGGSVAITAPKWVAAGGSTALLQWNKITEALYKKYGKIVYKNALSAWKDWEMTIHARGRLKAQEGLNLEQTVKKRFQKEIKNEKVAKMKLIFSPNTNRVMYFDIKNRDMSLYNHSIQYLNKVSDEYKKLSKRTLGESVLSRSLHEKKSILIDDVAKFSDDPKAKGVFITQEFLSEFVKRIYFALKSYKKK